MSDESPPVDEPEPQPSTSTGRRSHSLTGPPPKKGILKRSSLKAPSTYKGTPPVAPPQHRPSPDRFPDKPKTQIPKLSVTWWEKNAVAIFGDTSDENNTDSEQVLKDLGSGPKIRQTAIVDSEEDSEVISVEQTRIEDVEEEEEDFRDDAMSVASSTGSASSAVVGRWWTGKDTRYVPHCVKRGCNHSNHGGTSELGEYLTPTQRRNKEMNELRKELRLAILEKEEKDRHLVELRERISEMQQVTDTQTTLSDSHKLMQHERESREEYEKEKKMMEKKHAVRVNQLVQETLVAREEIARLNSRIQELEEILKRPRTETSTMTDPIQYSTPVVSIPQPPLSPTDPTDPSCFIEVNSPPLPTDSQSHPISPVHSLPDQSMTGSLLVKSNPLMMTSPLSVSMDSKISGQPMMLSQEAVNHMQAYQNEAFIWRTKAAQLEIVLKEQLLKYNQLEQKIKLQTGSVPDDVTYKDLVSLINNDPQPTSMQDSGIENQLINLQASPMQTAVVERPSTIIVQSECVTPSCMERKKSMIVENNQLLETLEDANTRIRELEDDVNSLRKEIDTSEELRQEIEEKLKLASKEVDLRQAEVAARDISIERLQSERETMTKAISFMEERLQVYQNTIMDHGLVISDESAENWRKGFVDPRYSVMICKKVQTELTSQSLSENESDFQATKMKLEKLHEEFSANRSDLHGRFEEIEKILLTKTQLVEVLSKQLEDTRKDQRAELDRHQTERETYKRSLEEMAQVAERVPILEERIQQLLTENSEYGLRFREQQEEYENGLEAALGESLKKYKEQSEYWKEKVSSMEKLMEYSKKEVVLLQREKEELKMKHKLEKAELEHRLTSSIDHVSTLNKKLNPSHRDVECEARPRQVSKYVACRPNVKNKSTIIEKGDLFNEAEERLKLCQGELQTTRRQVYTLQQKLVSTIQEKSSSDGRPISRRRIACVMERPSSADSRKPTESSEELEKLASLETRNAMLREKLSQVEEEKETIVRNEKDRIQHIASEFDNVRQELDQEIDRYESEKKWLKSRIRNLEKDNQELQKELEQLRGSSSSAECGAGDGAGRVIPRISVNEEQRSSSSLRKTLSEPEMGFDDDETVAKLRAENAMLKENMRQLGESLCRNNSGASRTTARSQLSPAFANLADDLSMVKNDLEQILSNLEEEEPIRTAEKFSLRSSTRSPLFSQGDVSKSDILDDVMHEWDLDEREQLERDLKRSRQERDELKVRNDRLMRELRTSTAELEVFRRETPSESTAGNSELKRSHSVVELVDGVDKDEAKRWKLKCGTMFRELNAMRSGYAKAMEERRDLRIEVAMLRGELELLKCQKQPEVVIHENPVSFRRGSTRESVVCTISQPSVSHERTRSNSGTRRRLVSSKVELEAMEGRRSRRRKSLSNYATAPQSVSSSMTSLDPEGVKNSAKPPLPDVMSQSWHGAASTSRSNTDVTSSKTDVMMVREEERLRSSSRTVSLREKVGRLHRENKMLQEQLVEMKKKQLLLEQKAGYRSGLDVDRLNRLEEEKEILRIQVEKLLDQIQKEQAPPPPSPAKYLEEQLIFSRQQNEMYERKIEELEHERSEMYLVMFKKGQQAAKMDVLEEKTVDSITQDRVVLKFLHDAFYYFLVNRGDSREHLQAIMTMLDFTSEQKEEISKRRGSSHR